ncbi:hypothetical protein HZF08_26250 [Paenibacillus sp. CGMCC 1.16610]|uniref:Uncharacterized protein n=1 Tax=Paenibacillus anseongense TaxID=2682845 RepID=A0ABW9U4I9_9BACL|nr:hypothetical protein [Paenibacillus anseongense]MBA2941795.1 hypothetical protein [Paenibacillus sp. CGMCC 1.16610]MVQ34313.1 hypothetical protein [Paenibacillus anseongense]
MKLKQKYRAKRGRITQKSMTQADQKAGIAPLLDVTEKKNLHIDKPWPKKPTIRVHVFPVFDCE